jgi:hypothetical protein
MKFFSQVNIPFIGTHWRGPIPPLRKTGSLKTWKCWRCCDSRGTGIVVAKLDPSAGALGPRSTVGDRLARAGAAPLICLVLRCLELEVGGQSGFMST